MATRKKFEVTNLQQVEDFAGKELTSTEEVEQVIEQMVAEQEKKSKPAKKQRTLKVVKDIAADHEPGQALPEDQAERAASGSGWQGEEITDAEMQEASKPQLKVVRKNSKGQEVQVAKKPAAKPAVKETRKKKTPKPKKEKRTETVGGHDFVTLDTITGVFKDAHAGMQISDLAKKYNLASSRVGRILSGSRGFAERMQRRAIREGRPDWRYPPFPFQYPKPEKSTSVEVGK